MGLSARLSSYFSARIRSRGADYYSRGSVHLDEVSDTAVEATVWGSSEYFVILELQKNTLLGICDCPYAADYGACKHLWATLLAADKKGFLSDLDPGIPLRLELDEGEFDNPDEDLDADDELYEDGEEPISGFGLPRGASHAQVRETSKAGKTKKAPLAAWKSKLNTLVQSLSYIQAPVESVWPPSREIGYIVDVSRSLAGGGLCLEIAVRERKQNGELSKFRALRIPLSRVKKLPDAADREIIPALVGASEAGAWASSYYAYDSSVPSRFRLQDPLLSFWFPRICQSGRCYLRPFAEEKELRKLQWDDGPGWEFWVDIQKAAAGDHFSLSGTLRRGESQMDLAEPLMLIAGGVLFVGDKVARLDDGGSFHWISQLRQTESFLVPAGQEHELIQSLMNLPHLPRLHWPAEFQVEQATGTPSPYLKVRKPKRYESYSDRLRGQLFFDYDGNIVAQNQPGRGVLNKEQRRFFLRDLPGEQAAATLLTGAGFRIAYSYSSSGTEYEIAPRHLPRAVGKLLAAGWRVEAEGKLYRKPGAIRIEVRSGIDWFELHGTVEYGDTTVKLPALLAALKRDDKLVPLGDGSFGMLPEEWLRKYGPLAALGTEQEDHLQFRPCQAGLLDALLASQPEASCDALFEKVRDQLRSFEGIQPEEAPPGFVGQLRGYQRDGLGWMLFLEKFGLGGCLADDMGLGKTVQILGLLELRRQQGENLVVAQAAQAQTGPPRPRLAHQAGGISVKRLSRPSLVVVPRSLVFNWKQEAARFTPGLRVLDHTGAERRRSAEPFNGADLVLTTYGTLRRDAAFFADTEFDYVILDEAQAIKNAHTASAKAARLLRGNHRLALSGTPIENHLGELWSLFEFLNPGMLGSASVFRLGNTSARNPDEETRLLLGRALRPFILRRTKDQVARELPAKLEQTLYCELESKQRQLYSELREHYRSSLLRRIEQEGLRKSKIQVLEALLRLRQAACHPGLIDKARTGESSAKLDMLLPQLVEVLEEGHKVLVFSQFTSLLAIVRERLDAEKIPYLYLDGSTRDRGSLVGRFQNQTDPKLFLISLKAGGLGLNLTAAEYVFLLDPWWNPAVEAQAIDRTHRIGQTRQVFAYRLIARDTVEEKVLALQQTKRDLADAILREDNGPISNLSREDLELLLS